MDLEDIMLCEISRQRKTVHDLTYMWTKNKTKNLNSQIQRINGWLLEVGKIDEGGQKPLTSSYKMNQSW